MTKIINTEKSSLLRVEVLKKYNERFPETLDSNSPLSSRKRFSSCPPSPSFYRDTDTIQERSEQEETVRRHTWSQSTAEPLFLRRTSFEARRNSGASSAGSSSMHEIIEECDSDEETDNESLIEYDYIRCINCSRSNSATSLDSSTSDPPHTPTTINYCYNCRHLSHAKQPHLPAFFEGRRSSWTAGDQICYSPRRSRRSSLTDSNELPIISEPSFDDETNDTKELQLIVKQEVDKLMKFKANSLLHTNKRLKLHRETKL